MSKKLTLTTLTKHSTSMYALLTSFVVILYFIHDPYSLHYYFHNALGRAVLLLSAIIITSIHPLIGFFLSLILIFIHNSTVLEGNDPDAKVPTITVTPPVKKEPPTSTTSLSTASPHPSSLNNDKKELPPPAEKSIPAEIPSGIMDASQNPMEMEMEKKQKELKKEKPVEKFSNMNHALSPSPYGKERNVIISAEQNIRSKSSNSLMITKHRDSKDGEPVSNYSGREGFSSTSATY